MATAVAHDGVELYWEARGSGPTVVLVPYWSLEPRLWAPVTAELERDHRVVRYDERGTGRSTRTGPFDMETSASDLEAVVEAAGETPVVALAMVDGGNRAVRVAARRPELVSHVVSIGGAPLHRGALSRSESMISSEVVVGAFMQQLAADYRGAVRGLMESANPQMTPVERRDRVAAQIEHVPQDVAEARIMAWAEDKGTEELSQSLGDRLVVPLGGTAGGGWFPATHELTRILREHFPEARIEEIDEGLISRPDQTAAIIRRLTSADAPAESQAASDLQSRA